MNASHICTACLWLRVTEYDMFQLAHDWFYGCEGMLEEDILAFNVKNEVPEYLYMFMLKRVYPELFVRGSLYVKNKLALTNL